MVSMDEPTLGLAPEAALEFLDLIRSLRAEGITIMLSSHLLHQVQAVCDRVGLFSQGRLVLIGPVDELARDVLGGGHRILVEAEGEGDLAAALGRVDGVLAVRREGPALSTIRWATAMSGSFGLRFWRSARMTSPRLPISVRTNIFENSGWALSASSVEMTGSI